MFGTAIFYYSGSFGSLGCAMGVVISIRVRFGGRWVHSVLFSSFGCAMGSVMYDVGMIYTRWTSQASRMKREYKKLPVKVKKTIALTTPTL